MADGGWVAVQRKLQTSFVWANPFVLKLWLLCLFKANFTNNRILFNGQEVRVDRGQFITGRVALAKEYNEGAKGEHQLSPTSINRWLKKFRDLGMVDISSNAKYSVVTVIHYDAYQPGGQLADMYPTAGGQLADTVKNSNNSKNDKNKPLPPEPPATRKDVLEFWESNGFGQLSPKTIQDLDYWVQDFEEIGSTEEQANQLLVKAMGIAVDSNVRRYAYVNSILKRWEQQKLKTPEEVDADERQRNARGTGSNSGQAGRGQGSRSSSGKGKSYGGIEY